MRWVTIFLAATACFFAIQLVAEVTLNKTPFLGVLNPAFLLVSFADSALMLALSGVIVVLPIWLVAGKRMGDRPGPWALAGAIGGSALMLFAAVFASTCQRGTELCPAEIADKANSLFLLAIVTGIGGAGAALAGLLAWRRTEPPRPGSRTDFRV